MKNLEIQYLDDLKLGITKKISEVINEKTIDLIYKDLAFHFQDRSSSNFQKF
ncbi:MAG: hypothetical protein P9L97_13545 [Candidatus Tenebribacter davisii]|nr:hypothetical protein [Candidatus Tenebribacter davisii]